MMFAACKSVHFSRGFFFISCCIAQHHNAVHAFATSGVAMNHYSSSTVVAAAATGADRCSEEESTNSKDALFRILCLHGKGGNGEEFLERLHPLRRVVDDHLMDNKHSNITIKWDALTAPYQMGDNDDDAYAWWTMKPGERSYNAQEYIGFDESASKVLKSVFPNSDQSSCCNYDLILGHSQGAILLSALLATNIDLQRSTCSYVLNGAAYPNPYKNALTSLPQQQSQHDNMQDVPMLFVMGRNDNINPIESAMQVHDAYKHAGLDVSIIYHDGGHSIPAGTDGDSKHALDDICDFILRAACCSQKG